MNISEPFQLMPSLPMEPSTSISWESSHTMCRWYHKTTARDFMSLKSWEQQWHKERTLNSNDKVLTLEKSCKWLGKKSDQMAKM